MSTRATRAGAPALATDGLPCFQPEAQDLTAHHAPAVLPMAFRMGLDLAATPMLALVGGRLVHANPPARQILRDGAVLHVQAGVLQIHRHDEQDALDSIITDLGQPGSAARILALRNRQERVVLILSFQALELPQAGRVVIIRVADLYQRPELDHAWLVRVFALTTAEARVVALLFAGQDIAGTAEALQVGIETVRTHLKRAMDKLGVNSQRQMLTMLHAALAAAEPSGRR